MQISRNMNLIRVFPLLTLVFASTAAGAQQVSAFGNFIANYQKRVTATQAEQPHWITPLVLVTPRLEQEVRSDFVRQVTPKGYSTWHLGNGKGLECIPERH